MATKRLLLINGIPFTNPKGKLIYKFNDNGKISYHTRDSLEDEAEYLEETLQRLMSFEEENELSPAIAFDATVSSVENRNFGLELLSTPLYSLQKQLSTSELGKRRIAGVNIDIGGIWETQQLNFFASEFYKYVRLVPFLEKSMNQSLSRPSNPSLAYRRGDKSVMRMVYASIDNVYNPFDAFKSYLAETKLFCKVYNPREDVVRSDMLDKPYVFPTIAVKDSTEVFISTSCDILHFCGVDHKAILSSVDLQTLMAGICLKYLGADIATNVNRELLEFPINKNFYEVRDPATGAVLNRFFNAGQAARAASDVGGVVEATDTDRLFVMKAFRSTSGTLVDLVRGADFVRE